jgi:sorbitol/mannitol transport system substrate-binding protein
LLTALENFPADYDLDDVFRGLRDGLSYEGKLSAIPFTGESSMLMYRKDLFDAKGLSAQAPESVALPTLTSWLTTRAF